MNPGTLLEPARSEAAGRNGLLWPLLLLAGLLVLAHLGCHGDEDNELFTAAVAGQQP